MTKLVGKEYVCKTMERSWCGWVPHLDVGGAQVAVSRTWPTRLRHHRYLLVTIAAAVVQLVTGNNATGAGTSVTDMAPTPPHAPLSNSTALFYPSVSPLPTLLSDTPNCVPPCDDDTYCVSRNMSQGQENKCYNCLQICETLILANVCSDKCSGYYKSEAVTANASVVLTSTWAFDHVTVESHNTSYNTSLPPGIILTPMNLRIRLSLASVGFVIAVGVMLGLMAVCSRLEKRFGPNQDEEYACILEDAFSVGVDDTVVWDSGWNKEPPGHRVTGGSHDAAAAGEGTSLRATLEQGPALTGPATLSYGTTTSSQY